MENNNTQSNPNSPHYNDCLIDLIERLRSGRFDSIEQIEALASDMPAAWRRHLINDALESLSA